MDANRKQAMVPEGAIALDPVGTAPGLVVPAGERVVIVLPGPPRELQPMWPVALETEPVREVLARATPLRGYTLRMFGVPGVGDRQEPARDRGRRGRRSTRSRSPPACAAARSRSTSATATRRRRSPTRCARACERATSAISSVSTARRSTPRWRSCCEGRRLGLAESCSGGLLAARITKLPGGLGLHGWQRRRLLERGEGGAAGRRSGADRRPRARSRPRWPRRWRSGRWSASGPTSRSRSPGSPGPTAAREEKPVGYVCFNARLADGTAIARDPGHPRRPRGHPRTLRPGRHAPAADPARRRRGAALERILEAARKSAQICCESGVNACVPTP